MSGKRFPAGLFIFTSVIIIVSSIGFSGCNFTSPLMVGPNLLTAWISDSWITTTTTEFNAGVPLNVNTSNNEVKLNFSPAGYSYIYGLSGDNSNYFTRFNVTANTWQSMPNTLAPIYNGGALTYDFTGGDFIYALAGGGTTNFTRYSISGNSWTGRANTLATISYGGALVYAQNYVFALAGGNTNNFTRYNPMTNTWTGMANTLAPINKGGSLAYAGGDFIYALAGGDLTNFTRYSISTNSWTGLAATPDIIGEGGGITWDGGNFLYAVAGGSGGGGKKFFRYNISTNTWTTLTDTQNPTKEGGAITSDRGDFIYIFQGGSTKFWRYSISATTWTELSGNLNKVGWGGSLVYVPGSGSSCYSSPGSIASIVLDTTTPGSRWDVLMWNATVPAGTTITFEVRASDTLFAATDATPAWTSVGGTSPVYPFLSLTTKGRYIQWRANLTSTTCASTPVLYDVTVYYTDP